CRWQPRTGSAIADRRWRSCERGFPRFPHMLAMPSMAQHDRPEGHLPGPPRPDVEPRADQWSTDAQLHPPPLSLYVHLPWCVRKCPYCDFNSHQARGPLPFEPYVDALLADLDHDPPLAWGRNVHSVFFGGGTPS